jgi:hypothetical protein
MAIADEPAHEGWAGVAEVMLDPADGIEGALVDGPIDAGDVDVRETDGHARQPGAAIAADLRFEAAFAGEQYEGLPDVAAPERGLGIEARLPMPLAMLQIMRPTTRPSTWATSSRARTVPLLA